MQQQQQQQQQHIQWQGLESLSNLAILKFKEGYFIISLFLVKTTTTAELQTTLLC